MRQGVDRFPHRHLIACLSLFGPLSRLAPGIMAQVGHRVDYLAGFCCPVGGLAAGKPRVLCHGNQIYLSNGTEYVYIYDQEGRLMKVSGVWLAGPLK